MSPIANAPSPVSDSSHSLRSHPSTPSGSSAMKCSKGPDVLCNPLLIEAIIPALPNLQDIHNLSLVSRQVFLLVQSIYPLSAVTLSFGGLASVKNKHVVDTVHRYLRRSPLSQRRLLENGHVVAVGGRGLPYAVSWRYLKNVELSGTTITGRVVKLLIAACSGGNIPGLLRNKSLKKKMVDRYPELGVFYYKQSFFYREFDDISPQARRLLTDGSLHLERLSVVGCSGVEVKDITEFLRKILILVTCVKRKEIRNIQAAQHAQNPHNTGILNQGVFHMINNMPAQGPINTFRQEDLGAIPSPLPSTAAELGDFGLPCFSIKRLEMCNVSGLQVYPPERFRGKREWGYSQECPYGKNIASLNLVAGCLGLDVDVMFCQGAGCATAWTGRRTRTNQSRVNNSNVGISGNLANTHLPRHVLTPIAEGMNDLNDDFPPVIPFARRNPSPRQHNTTYNYPVPWMPGESLLVDGGRVFRIPGGYSTRPPAQAQPQQPNGQGQSQGNITSVNNYAGTNVNVATAVPAALAAMSANNLLHWDGTLFLPDPAQYGIWPVTPAPEQGQEPQEQMAGGLTQPLTPPLIQQQFQSENNLPSPILDPQPDNTASTDIPPAWGQVFSSVSDSASHTHNSSYQDTAAWNQAFANIFPAPSLSNPNQPSPPDDWITTFYRELRARLHPRSARTIAMLDGPRGLCDGCGGEVWLCEACNRYWSVTCGACAAKQI